MRKFSVLPRGFLLFSGKNGTGKTFAAQAILETFEPKKHHPEYNERVFITQSKLNILWHKDISKWGNTYQLLDRLIYPELLVLDDIGTRIPSEAFMDFLYILVDERYSNKNDSGTILTTNLNAHDMREKFGDSFVSRVASGKCFRLEHEDRRFKKDFTF